MHSPAPVSARKMPPLLRLGAFGRQDKIGYFLIECHPACHPDQSRRRRGGVLPSPQRNGSAANEYNMAAEPWVLPRARCLRCIFDFGRQDKGANLDGMTPCVSPRLDAPRRSRGGVLPFVAPNAFTSTCIRAQDAAAAAPRRIRYARHPRMSPRPEPKAPRRGLAVRSTQCIHQQLYLRARCLRCIFDFGRQDNGGYFLIECHPACHPDQS
jgi:hypothetical protein